MRGRGRILAPLSTVILAVPSNVILAPVARIY
jgi:hypothetical protein